MCVLVYVHVCVCSSVSVGAQEDCCTQTNTSVLKNIFEILHFCSQAAPAAAVPAAGAAPPAVAAPAVGAAAPAAAAAPSPIYYPHCIERVSLSII